MAGLTRLKDPKKAPLFPHPDSSLGFWSGMGNGVAGYYYLPGFSGGTAGRSIRIQYSSNTANIYFYNADASEVTAGAWNGGLTVDAAAGQTEPNEWVNLYMDETDNKLFIVTANTGTTPDTLYTTSINEAGVVTQIGNAQIGNASMDTNKISYNTVYGPSMSRAGGDGSGNIVLTTTNTAGGNSALAAPRRGAKITIDVSDGSLSYSNLLGDVFSGATTTMYGYGLLGPTANNIIWITYSPNVATSPSLGINSELINTATGKHVVYSLTGVESLGPWGTGSMYSTRWRGRYFFPNAGTPMGYANVPFLEADVHHYMDELAVYYGIL
tara:strand:- start:1128 stop:2105 length:978 start_codon:yes stop_codon:yes gene_type:complete